jgi:streptogramin lyase
MCAADLMAQTCGHPACGATIDTLNGVQAYSNACSGSTGCYDGLYEWECVEFVHRYYQTRFNIDIGSVPTAIQMLTILQQNPTFEVHTQPDASGPQADDIVVFGVNGNTPVGHVAIVKANPLLQPDLTYVVPIIEQNSYYPHNLLLQNTSGTYSAVGRVCDPSLCTCNSTSTICDGTAPILGWIRLATAPPAPGTIVEYPLPNNASGGPINIVSGPDGNLWFTEYSGEIGRITIAGAIAGYPLQGSGLIGADGITVGRDGALWFTEFNGNTIGRITTAGAISVFPIPGPNNYPDSIVAGIDGNLWFTEQSSTSGTPNPNVSRITPSGAITTFPLAVNSSPQSIAVGPDLALWYADSFEVGRISVAGSITTFSIAPYYNANSITSGPDSALWFTSASFSKVFRLTTSGVISSFAIPSGELGQGIAVGPDGALWFAEQRNIGRITTTGTISEFLVPTPNSGPSSVTAGPDGNIWFTELFGGKIGRLFIQ